MKLQEGVEAGATFGGPSGPPEAEDFDWPEPPPYRYTLWRVWRSEMPMVNFVMLNPSTATATEDDATIRKCQGYARRWGFGGLWVTNIFALRARDPKKLYEADKPMGPWNDAAIQVVAQDSRMVVAAWGTHGRLHGRGEEVRRLVAAVEKPLYHLGLTKENHPKHPLYLTNGAQPIPWGHG